MALAGRFIRIGLVLGILFIDTVVGQVHELVAEALHGRGVPGSEEKGRGKTGRQQVDTGPNISPHPEEVEDKQTDLFQTHKSLRSMAAGKVSRIPQLLYHEPLKRLRKIVCLLISYKGR